MEGLLIIRINNSAQNYEVSGLCPSSAILNATKHNVSETEFVSVLRLGERDSYSVGSLG
jgi:hypothetical protein